MELRDLRCFVAVVEEGSFTRAAQRLQLSQPSVSTAIARLETEFGTRLLDRSSHPVRPTRIGRVLLERATTVLESVEDLRQAVRGSDQRPRVLRAGLFGSGAGPYTPRVLQLMSVASGRELQVSTVRLGEQVPAVVDGRVDVVISTGPLEDPRVNATPLFTTPRVAIVGRNHPLAGARTLTVQDLLDQPFLGVALTGSGPWADWWNLVPERGGRQPQRWLSSATSAADPLAFLHQHAQGSTVGVAPSYLAQSVPGESVGVRYIPVRGLSPATVVAVTRAAEAPDLLAAVQATARRLSSMPVSRR